ncbi:flavin reductase family protein [Georgenia sp. TF02-10]|uniref:flavin reductase family protein n=1 Tax=Georgenia sp. TF02-10 TaxID=2917725 RepID=UPI001FA7896C|nr:flavin reductase family protein [Georgenia sp. TF02-10]UNX55670.1 flavin reductase family protein [Georgenia sp. TF02-10]
MPDQSDLIDRFRATMARRPAGVTVVSVRHAGLDLAMTATDVASVSLRPPMVLFCVYTDARLREALDEVDTWALSVLDRNGAVAADRLAMPGRPAFGQLVGIAHHRGAASGAALLDDAQGWVECRTAWIRNAGDHDVVVGEVLDARLGATGTGGLVHHLGRVRPLP